MGDPIRAYLVCGGKYHDMDFARVELLKLLGENAEIKTRVAEDYADTAAIAESDFLITYTCDVRPERGRSRRRCPRFVAERQALVRAARHQLGARHAGRR